MSDGSGCLHEAMKNSFKIPTSMECAQCGKSELLILRHRIASAEQDKLGLIKVTHGLQDRIASLEAENARLREAAQSVVDSATPHYDRWVNGVTRICINRLKALLGGVDE